MSSARVLTRNVFSNWANLGVSIAIGFLMMPFLVSRLGDMLYGVWTLVVALVGYGNLLDFGVRSSIVKYVSQHHANDDRDRLRSLFNTTLAAYMVIGALVLILAIGVAFFMPYLFHLPAELTGEAQLVLLIVGVNLALKFPSGVFEGFLTGLQRYEIANAIAIGCNLLRAALTVALISKGQKLLALAAVGLVIDILMSVLMSWVCLRLLPWLSLGWRHLSKAVLREVYTYGAWSLIIAAASRLLYDSDSILIGMFLPVTAITHFAVANNLVRYLRQLALGLSNVFTPAASDLEARSEHERLERLLIQGTRYALAVILPAAVLLALLGPEFLTLWMGPQYAAESGAVLLILVLSQAIAMAQFPVGAMLYGLNRHRSLALITLGEALFKLIFCLALLPRLGILAAALGTAIPQLASSLALIPALITRLLKLPLSRYFREAFLPPLASVLPVGVLVFCLKIMTPPTSWSMLIAQVVAGLSLYGVLAVRFCLDKPRRLAVSGLLRGALWSRTL